MNCFMENRKDSAALDGAKLIRREEAMAYLAGILPDLRGRNLDALYDSLTDLTSFRMILFNREILEETDFGRRLLTVLRDAAAENPYLNLEER